MAFKGRGRIAGAATLPLEVEWSFEDYETNVTEDLDPGPSLPIDWDRRVLSGDSAQDGWRARQRRRRLRREAARGEVALDSVTVSSADSLAAERAGTVVIILPPRDVLEESPELRRVSPSPHISHIRDPIIRPRAIHQPIPRMTLVTLY